VLGTGDVLGMGSVQPLHHLDAEAGIVTEENTNWCMATCRVLLSLLTNNKPEIILLSNRTQYIKRDGKLRNKPS
jgi:hypothetical protein